MLFDTESKRYLNIRLRINVHFFRLNPPIHMNYPVKTKELIKFNTLIKFP